MLKMAINCWQIKQCGREPHGKNSNMGVCPVFTAINYDGVNKGHNGGRICWAISGTFCDGKVQGSYAQKRLSCLSCEVYKQIKTEESHDFVITVE